MNTARQRRWVVFGLLLAAAVAWGRAREARAADDTYAAIAYSDGTGKYGYGSKCASREEAEQKAIQDCGEKDAKAVIWTKGAWCALAVGDGGIYAYDWGATEADARAKAKKICAQSTTHARIVLVVASTGERGGADGAVIGAATDFYAAVAGSASTEKYGSAVKCASREEAEQKAIRDCGAADAKVLIWCRNGWCALAKGDKGLYGWDKGATAAEARANTLKQCERNGFTGRVILCVSARGEPEKP